jgi:hypothetical protein
MKGILGDIKDDHINFQGGKKNAEAYVTGFSFGISDNR